jgi:hypothetical protein
MKEAWYPIELPLSYECLTDSSVKGLGLTFAINSSVVRFVSDQDLGVGLLVRLVISWPARLADGISLSLSLSVRIKQSDSRQVEIAVFQPEFRTRTGLRSEASDWVHALKHAARQAHP